MHGGVELRLDEIRYCAELGLARVESVRASASMRPLESLVSFARQWRQLGGCVGIRRTSCLGDPNAADAVDRRMMQLGVDGELPILETFDDVGLPKRATLIEQRGVEL